MYEMIRKKGMSLSLFYDDEGFWRVTSSQDESRSESCAQTVRANLELPYGEEVRWKIKYSLLEETGYGPCYGIEVGPLDEKEYTFKKASENCHLHRVRFMRTCGGRLSRFCRHVTSVWYVNAFTHRNNSCKKLRSAKRMHRT